MTDDKKIYIPSSPLRAARSGVLTTFEPGTRTLEADYQAAPPFQPLPVDMVLEKDVAVTLRNRVTVYVDVLRPVGVEKVTVIVAYSLYGKGQGTSPSVMGIFGLVGLDNRVVSGLEKFEGPDARVVCGHASLWMSCGVGSVG